MKGIDLVNSLEQLSSFAASTFPTLDEAFDALLKQVVEILGMRTSYISHIDEQREYIHLQAAHDRADGCHLTAGMTAPLQVTFCTLTAQYQIPILLENVNTNPRSKDLPAITVLSQVKSYIGVPILKQDGTLYGTLCALDPEPHALSMEYANFLTILARLVATYLERESELRERLHAEEELRSAHVALQKAHDQLVILARNDSLTGLPNHRTIYTTLEEQFKQAVRTGTVLAACFVDLDHFKSINDTYGHLAGDTVLRDLGNLLHTNVRQADTVGRWGGEEFLVLLPGVTPDLAYRIAERLRGAVASHRFPIGDGLSLTASLGVALYPHDAISSKDLVELADQAMYRAKATGRDRVCVV